MFRFLLFCLPFFSLNLFAQKELKDFYLNRSLKQEGLQFNFKVLDEDKHGVWIYNKKKYYFWYKAQKVISTQGESSGILLNGEFEAFYPNKQLSRKGQFRKGLKNGEWLYWRDNGSLLFEEFWIRGELRREKWYDEQGKVVRSLSLHGRKIYRDSGDSTIISTKNGKHKTIYVRDGEGRIQTEEHYKHGQPHGKWRTYEEGAEISRTTYKNGDPRESSDSKSEKKSTKEHPEEAKERKPWRPWKDWFKRKSKTEESTKDVKGKKEKGKEKEKTND